MNLLCSLTLIWALVSTAGALQCMTCTDQACSSTAPLTCSSETMCITASIQATSSGTTGTQIYKACASSALCPITGSQTFSVNLGVSGAMASAQCCNTDNCNSQTLPSPSTQPANSLQCHYCNPATSQCTTSLQCSGSESSCISATVTIGSTTSPVLGCVSPNTCLVAGSLGSLPFMQNVGSISSRPTCCTTSLCNSPRTPTTATTTTTTTIKPTTTPTTTKIPSTKPCNTKQNNKDDGRDHNSENQGHHNNRNNHLPNNNPPRNNQDSHNNNNNHLPNNNSPRNNQDSHNNNNNHLPNNKQ